MKTLLVDIGNTRAKWAVLSDEKLGPAKALTHEGGANAMVALLAKAPRDVSRVFAVSVAGPRLNQALTRAARARGLRVTFVKSTRAAGGVTNGYKEVWRLGADRWAGAIGAHQIARGRGVLLAMVGTALTIDLVTAEGRHLGGAIVPGPATMVASLLSGTKGIRRRAQGLRGSSRKLFAVDTASALAAGSQVAAAAFIDRAVAEAAKTLASRPLLLLSGGGAADLRRHLRSARREVPDLVLRGLAVLASQPSRDRG